MPSPFPGMDPYLEHPAFWSDFHYTYVNYWREAIADALPTGYEASLGDGVYLVEQDPAARKLGHPDVSVTRGNGAAGGGLAAPASVATLEPVTIPLTILDGPRETYIEILHQPEHTLVTVLELLSPANKEEPGRTQYLAKRRALIHQSVHLVELDLLRGGQRVEQALPLGDCYYFLSRAEQRPDCRVYSWSLPEPLPRLPVPLRAPDPDIRIDLGAVFTTAYDRGRFARRLGYAGPVPPHLSAAERVWAGSVVRAMQP